MKDTIIEYITFRGNFLNKIRTKYKVQEKKID